MYERVFGLACSGIEVVAEQDVRTAFFIVGATKIELLESLSPHGPIGKFIEKKGEGVHHIAFAVDDVAGALRDAEEKGAGIVDRKPRRGAEGLDTGFLHPRSTRGVLIELCGVPPTKQTKQ
jgi:methylmalonyl-CoA/ethylmalonyl-CoA epimerase